MTSPVPLLVELFTEELPPKSLKTLARAFADLVVAGLQARGLAVDSGAPEVFATPRRLGVRIPHVEDQGSARLERRKLMPATVAYDASGTPTAALTKRLDKEGATLADVATRDDQVWLERSRPGVVLADALQGALDEAIARLPIPKRMNYQRHDADGGESTVQFVRPVHGLVALHGDGIVDVGVLGLRATRSTAGHRFLGKRRVAIASASTYESTLEHDGRVIASFETRRAAIVDALVASAGSDVVVMPDALLDEVAALVEWPAVYRGTFDPTFLDVPQECLILTMQQNQKYFALTDATGRLVDRFLVVSNIATDEPSRIVEGNERVLRARLADAKFFYDQDRKRTLASRVGQLKTVVYHNKLGTQHARMERVRDLAGRIAPSVGADVDDARRAAELAKTDLVTDMVGEFPELQGLMGRYYALHDGEKPEVAAAIEEQYRPRFAGDALPTTPTGTALALADKLETIVGLFGIGAMPTGDKDPFALRRHALGVVRMLVEKNMPLQVSQLVALALAVVPPQDRASEEVASDVDSFVRGRLASYCRDLGYTANEVDAVLAEVGPLADVRARLAAVRAFASLPESASLASADKRVRNILAKTTRADAGASNAQLLTAEAEIALSQALDHVAPRADEAYRVADFESALLALATLKAPVDRFFDEVMVNVDDPAVRSNRLGLLRRLHHSMNRVADLSKLAA